MNKSERTVLTKKFIFVVLSIMLMLTMISVSGKAQEVTGLNPKLVNASLAGGEEKDVFYKGFDDELLVKKGYEILLEFEGGYSVSVKTEDIDKADPFALYFIYSDGDSEFESYIKLHEEEGGKVYVDYGSDYEGNFTSLYLYTKRVLEPKDMERLPKGRISVNQNIGMDKYYLVEASSLITGQEGFLHTYLSGVYDYGLVELYTVDGIFLWSYDDESLYFKIKKGETYVLCLCTNGDADSFTADLITEDVDYSTVPEYKMGTQITVPAKSIVPYFVSLSKYMRCVVNGLGDPGFHFYIVNSDGDYNWYRVDDDNRVYYPDEGTPINPDPIFEIKSTDLAGECLIVFDNWYDNPITIQMTPTDANGNEITLLPPVPTPSPTPQPTPTQPSKSTPATSPSAPSVGSSITLAGSQYKVTSASTASLLASKNGKTATVPASITINGKNYAVTGIEKNAFKNSKAKTLVVKSKALTKKSVKGCLKGTKVKVVKVKVGKKKENKKFVKKYKKIFTKKICGKKVTVK